MRESITRRVPVFPLFITLILAVIPALLGARSASAEPFTHARRQAAGSATLLAAGDIEGCQSGRPASTSLATAAIIQRNTGTVAPLGDLVQDTQARLRDFQNCYGPAWGRFLGRTRPTPGNHDYATAGAAGYFSYFGPRAGTPGRGYYSYLLGSWHIVVLNSNCAQVGGCGAGSPQDRWLRADLAAHPSRCTLAYWHHPLFSSAYVTLAPNMRRFWQDLYSAGADVVLNGHLHVYERFAPQTPYGRADPARGIREFVVGTGGTGLGRFRVVKANSQVRNASTHGVLRLTLGSGWYQW